ncbi:hypothetical protein [Rugamonas aquatica]|uniref:Uncharacterized protein n=1 Tax=Rugamonas aquatica TaxID=2743357 RepID=A0A6A7MUG3_9BURK|nr:hypothetical protein [Rugamonas aquatica]MQA36757.1 hypothetical protein [Rugamonas aquatica]
MSIEMTEKFNPQEIFLIERYISVAYFGQLRDVWGEMIRHIEKCLDNYMARLSLEYRNRPLPEQPDVVWGERVLPNFRNTFQELSDGYILLSSGSLNGLNYCHGPMNDFKGQQEFWSGWMNSDDDTRYRKLLITATNMSGNIAATVGAHWELFELERDYMEALRGPLDLPEHWPAYQVDQTMTVLTGDKPTIAGIYVPDVENSCAEYISVEFSEAPACRAWVRSENLIDDTTGKQYGTSEIFEDRLCRWTLVKRMSEASATKT